MLNRILTYAKILPSNKNLFMQNIIIIIQIVISILLTIFVLVQNKDGGLSAMMGGGGSFQSTKRGPEKFIYNATIVLGALFLVNAVIYVII